MILVFEVKSTAFISINFAMQFFDKYNPRHDSLYNFDVINLFNFYNTKNAKEYLNFLKLSLRRA